MKILNIIYITGLLIPSLHAIQSNRPYYIDKNAKIFNIDPDLLMAICSVESKCRTTAINHNDGTRRQKTLKIISKSYGMFQIKYVTAKSLGFKGKKVDLLKPEINSYYAAKLLASLYHKYKKTVKVLSAYNAGKYTTKNKKYVNNVLSYYANFKIDRRYK